MRRWQFLALLAAAGLVGPALGAPPDDDKKPASAQQSPADELRAIQTNFRQMQQKFSQAYRDAKTQEEKQKVLQGQRPDPKPLLERCVKLAQAHPDAPAAFDALVWALQIGPGTPEGRKAEEILAQGFIAKAPLSELASKLQNVRLFSASKLPEAVLARVEAHPEDKDAPKLLSWVYRTGMFSPNVASDKARQLLLDKYINDDAIAELCSGLAMVRGQPQSEQAKQLRQKNGEQLKVILDKSTNPKVQAAACYALGNLKKSEGDEGKAEAEKLFERVVKEFGSANKAFAARARGELNELRGLLAEGKPAPVVEGVDLDGKSFKLSDYKGKVVLLDFWGFW